MNKIVILLSILCLISCKESNSLSVEEERALFEQSLPTVLDSIHLSIFPPPQNDSMVDLYENGKMLIIIKDSTEILSKEDQIRFSEYYKNILVKIDSSYQTKVDDEWYETKNLNSHKVKLNLKNERYNFIFDTESSTSNLPEGEKIFCGMIGLSDIKLDDSKQYALYAVSYKCCDRLNCGNGWNVYLKRNNNLWVIDAIIGTWIN